MAEHKIQFSIQNKKLVLAQKQKFDYFWYYAVIVGHPIEERFLHDTLDEISLSFVSI